MGLKEAAKKFQGSGGGAATENVLVQVSEIKTGDKPDAKKDCVVGKLIHPAFGLAAGSEVTVYARPADVKPGKRAPRSIYDLPRKFVSAQPVQPGGVVLFERTYVDKDGALNAGYVKAMMNTQDRTTESVIPNIFTSVDKIREQTFEDRGQETKRHYQSVTMVDVGRAKRVTTADELRATVREMLEMTMPGKSGALIRAISPEEEFSTSVRFTRRMEKVSDDVYEPENIDKAMEAFESQDKVKDLFYANLEDPEAAASLIFEVMPCSSMNMGSETVTQTVERIAKAEAEGKSYSDLSSPYRAELVLDDEENGQRTVTVSGFTPSHIGMRRRDADHSFVVHHAKPSENQKKRIYLADTLPSANVPPALAAKWEQTASTGHWDMSSAEHVADQQQAPAEQAPAAEQAPSEQAPVENEPDIGETDFSMAG